MYIYKVNYLVVNWLSLNYYFIFYNLKLPYFYSKGKRIIWVDAFFFLGLLNKIEGKLRFFKIMGDLKTVNLWGDNMKLSLKRKKATIDSSLHKLGVSLKMPIWLGSLYLVLGKHLLIFQIHYILFVRNVLSTFKCVEQ